MNRFKQDVKKLIETRKTVDQKTYDFLIKVKDVLGLNDDDVESIAKNHVRPKIGRFEFIADRSTLLEFSSINIAEQIYLIPTNQGVMVPECDHKELFEAIDNYLNNVDIKKLKEVKSENV